MPEIELYEKELAEREAAFIAGFSYCFRNFEGRLENDTPSTAMLGGAEALLADLRTTGFNIEEELFEVFSAQAELQEWCRVNKINFRTILNLIKEMNGDLFDIYGRDWWMEDISSWPKISAITEVSPESLQNQFLDLLEGSEYENLRDNQEFLSKLNQFFYAVADCAQEYEGLHQNYSEWLSEQEAQD